MSRHNNNLLYLLCCFILSWPYVLRQNWRIVSDAVVLHTLFSCYLIGQTYFVVQVLVSQWFRVKMRAECQIEARDGKKRHPGYIYIHKREHHTLWLCFVFCRTTMFMTARWRNCSRPINITRPASSRGCKFMWSQDGAVVPYYILDKWLVSQNATFYNLQKQNCTK